MQTQVLGSVMPKVGRREREEMPVKTLRKLNAQGRVDRRTARRTLWAAPVSAGAACLAMLILGNGCGHGVGDSTKPLGDAAAETVKEASSDSMSPQNAQDVYQAGQLADAALTDSNTSGQRGASEIDGGEAIPATSGGIAQSSGPNNVTDAALLGDAGRGGAAASAGGNQAGGDFDDGDDGVAGRGWAGAGGNGGQGGEFAAFGGTNTAGTGGIARPGAGGTTQGGGGPGGSTVVGGSIQAGGGGDETGGPDGGDASESGTGRSAACLDFGQPEVAGQVESTELSEISGLVASRSHPGVFFAHADSGDTARFFAMDASGKKLGTFALSGVTANDWEDIAWGKASDGSGVLYLGDIGDNAEQRSQIQVYRIAEPVVSPTQSYTEESLAGAQRLRFTYPDRPHNSETLMFDPVTWDIVIVTKETNGASGVFRAPGTSPPDEPVQLDTIATLSLGSGGQSALATGGDISPAGDRILLRTYTAILIWARNADETLATALSRPPKELPSPTERQGEALTFTADGNAWIAASENETTLYRGRATCK